MITVNRRRPAVLAIVSVVFALGACGSPATSAPGPTQPTSVVSPSETAPTPAAPSAAAKAILVVSLGDSATTGHGDPSGKGWVQYLADRVHTGLGLAVSVQNLAVDGTTSAALLGEIRSDQSMRAAISAADIIVIGIGGNDLNLGDEAMQSGACDGKACYDKPIADYRMNLTAIAAQIAALHPNKAFVLRAIGMPNALTGAESQIPDFLKPIATEVGAYEAKSMDEATCAAMQGHGMCVPLLAAFNGPKGTDNAYAKGLMNLDECCYPSEAGQQLIADLVYRTGLAPLETP